MKVNDALAVICWLHFSITIETKPGFYEYVNLNFEKDDDDFHEKYERYLNFKDYTVSGIAFDEINRSFKISCWYEDQPKHKRRKSA